MIGTRLLLHIKTQDKRALKIKDQEARLANQDKRLKSIIISFLPHDVMKAIIKCKTAKAMWNDLILAHEGPSDTRNTKIAALRLKFNAFKALECEKDSDSNVEEDLRSNSEFIADLNAECHERDLLANQKRFYKRSGRDEESVSSKDDGTTKIKAFMKIAEEEPYVGKVDARSDYTYVDLHYVEDQRKNLVNKFNLLKQELSLHKSELCNLKNIVSINCSLQNEVIRVNLENESLKDEISNLKRPWRRGKRKRKISLKDVIFTKEDESSSILIPEITYESESECETHEPLSPLPKLIGAEPAEKRPETKPPAVPIPHPEKKADPSAEQLLLMEEVKSLKEQIKVPSDNSPSVS
ncbi:hypothetical protein Tco_1210986 [Tanacetum coccineum]